MTTKDDLWRPVARFPAYEMNLAGVVRKPGKRFVAEDGEVLDVPTRTLSTKGGEVYLMLDGVRYKRKVGQLLRDTFGDVYRTGVIPDA